MFGLISVVTTPIAFLIYAFARPAAEHARGEIGARSEYAIALFSATA